MGKRQIHLIADDLGEGAVETWAAEGLRQLEDYLAKHAAFLSFLDSRDA
jgi:hypothetical protein